MQRLVSAGRESRWSLTAGSTVGDCPCSRTGVRAVTGTCKCPQVLKPEGIKRSSTGILFHPHLPALTHSHLLSRRADFLINVFNVYFLTWKTFLYFLAGHFRKRFTDLFHILPEISLKCSLVTRLAILAQDHRLRETHSN